MRKIDLMKDSISNQRFKAVIITKNGEPCPGLQGFLSEKGFSATTMTASEALAECSANPPDLAIVQDDLGPVTGARFLSQLLGLSWKTSTVLITDQDEEIVHDRTEGLGILGSIRSADDLQRLDALLETFFNIVS